MNTIIERFNKTKSNINSLNPLRPVNIIAVSKTFSLNYIMPLVEYGHIHYGENKVQEAYSKWNDLKKQNQHCDHLSGLMRSLTHFGLPDCLKSLENNKLIGLSFYVLRVLSCRHCR